MFIIEKKFITRLDGSIIEEPMRQLNEEEKSKVIAIWGGINNYLYFEDKDTNSEEWNNYQKHINQESEKISGAALQALMSASPEEIQQIKQFLGIK